MINQPQFNQHYIKTGMIDPRFGRMLNKAQLSRQRSDYGDYVIVTQDEVQKQLKNAKEMITEIERMLMQQIDDF